MSGRVSRAGFVRCIVVFVVLADYGVVWLGFLQIVQQCPRFFRVRQAHLELDGTGDQIHGTRESPLAKQVLQAVPLHEEGDLRRLENGSCQGDESGIR